MDAILGQRTSKIISILFIIILLFVNPLFAENLQVGQTITPFSLPDQFGKKHIVNSQDYSILIITGEKDISIMLNKYLKTKKKTFLPEHHAIYISDIHSMPSLITRFFALPKMRKYPFKLLLIYDKEKNIFPMKDKSVTVIQLHNNKISSICKHQVNTI